MPVRCNRYSRRNFLFIAILKPILVALKFAHGIRTSVRARVFQRIFVLLRDATCPTLFQKCSERVKHHGLRGKPHRPAVHWDEQCSLWVVTTSLKIRDAVIPRNVFTQPGSKREFPHFGFMSASSASSGHWVANASAAW